MKIVFIVVLRISSKTCLVTIIRSCANPTLPPHATHVTPTHKINDSPQEAQINIYGPQVNIM